MFQIKQQKRKVFDQSSHVTYSKADSKYFLDEKKKKGNLQIP